MTVVRLKGMLMVILAAGVMAACGGGGGGGGGTAAPTGAVMTVLTTAVTATAYASAGIGGVGLSLSLPDGVSVKMTGENVESSVAVASGVAQGKASVIAAYSAATSTLPAKLTIVSTSTVTAGFGVGEFLTVNFIVSSGTPTSGSFSILGFTPVTIGGASIAGLGAGFTLAVQ